MTDFDSVILPGQEGKVVASINSKTFKGPISKSVTVTTNDPKNKRILLRLKAEIVVPIDVQPSDRIAVRGPASALEPKEVWLIANDAKAFDVLEVKSRNENVDVRLEPAPDRARLLPNGTKAAARTPAEGAVPGGGGHSAYKVTITFADTMPVGRFAETVDLRTNSEAGGIVSLRLNGKAEGPLTISPEKLFFISRKPAPTKPGTTVVTNAKPGYDPLVKTVRVKKAPGNTDGGELAVTSALVDDDTFKAEVKNVRPGEFEVTVRYEGETGVGLKKANLTLTTNDPNQGEVVVPIQARL